jgi:phosphoribosylformylglycinamidine cyclo-ligase
MVVNDLVAQGAEPIIFLDYIAMASLDREGAKQALRGIAEGCRRAGCALLGGETATMPDVYQKGDLEMVGFGVGVVERDKLIDGSSISQGDVILGLASSGVHSNGYSLVRSALLPRYRLDEHLDELGRILGDELLEPCTIYTPDVLALHRDGLLHAAAHITGGGIGENLPRALPAELDARIERGSWIEPPIFGLIQRAAEISDDDMFATFNMGLGMVLVVGQEHVDDVLVRTRGRGSVVGEVVPSEAERSSV